MLYAVTENRLINAEPMQKRPSMDGHFLFLESLNHSFFP